MTGVLGLRLLETLTNCGKSQLLILTTQQMLIKQPMFHRQMLMEPRQLPLSKNANTSTESRNPANRNIADQSQNSNQNIGTSSQVFLSRDGVELETNQFNRIKAIIR